MKKGSKYHPLYLHLQQSEADEVKLLFDEIESLIGRALPPTARTQRAWWSNRQRGAVQAVAWMSAGYHVMGIELEEGIITFRKPGLVYHIERDGDTILWDGELVRAFRYFMGFSQAELADKLGVRQQTISEWETGAYRPKRSTSKFLTLIAEQADFTYGGQIDDEA